MNLDEYASAPNFLRLIWMNMLAQVDLGFMFSCAVCDKLMQVSYGFFVFIFIFIL